MTNLFDESLTLDPPGSIAIIGGGPLGVETALYGRFLGYEINLYEAKLIGAKLNDDREAPVPMLPDRCITPLACSAIQAQFPELGATTLPLTNGQWVDQLDLICQTDLLRNRIVMEKVQTISQIAIEPESDDEDVDDVPADFRIHFAEDGQEKKHNDHEAVIVTTGELGFGLQFDLPAEYFFHLTPPPEPCDAEGELWHGFHQVVRIFAQLAGRAQLDLYRPQRG